MSLRFAEGINNCGVLKGTISFKNKDQKIYVLVIV